MSSKKGKLHHFRLEVVGLDREKEGLEDILYKDGLDDALLLFVDNRSYLVFSYTEDTYFKSIRSAVKRVESSSLGLMVMKILSF